MSAAPGGCASRRMPGFNDERIQAWIGHGTVPPLGVWAFTCSWAPTKIHRSSGHPIILKSCAKRPVPVIARDPTAGDGSTISLPIPCTQVGRVFAADRNGVRAGRLIWTTLNHNDWEIWYRLFARKTNFRLSVSRRSRRKQRSKPFSSCSSWPSCFLLTA